MFQRRSRIPALATLLIATCWTFPSRAQTTVQQRAIAQALFDEAQSLTGKGEYAAACPKFAESQKLDPAIGTQYFLAACFEHLGRTASAWTNYVEVADKALAAGQHDRATFARERAEALSPKLVRLTISLPLAIRSVGGLTIERDGIVVGKAQWELAVPLDPGEHIVRASATAHGPWEQRVRLDQPGTTVVVTVGPLVTSQSKTVPEQPIEPAPIEPPIPVPQPGASSGMRVAGLVVGGVGVAGLALGAGLGGATMSLQAQSDTHCNGNACDPDGVMLRDDAMAMANGSTAAFAVGSAAVAAGLLLVLLAPDPSTEAALIAPTIDADGAAILLRW